MSTEDGLNRTLLADERSDAHGEECGSNAPFGKEKESETTGRPAGRLV